jgi:hypothetical protein
MYQAHAFGDKEIFLQILESGVSLREILGTLKTRESGL